MLIAEQYSLSYDRGPVASRSCQEAHCKQSIAAGAVSNQNCDEGQGEVLGVKRLFFHFMVWHSLIQTWNF